MKMEHWIFSVCYYEEQPQGSLPPIKRWAVVGPARSSTVEVALHLAKVPEKARSEIRSDETVRKFVDGMLDPEARGYYTDSAVSAPTWIVCIGSVHEVLDR
jgi:hypothetical protein